MMATVDITGVLILRSITSLRFRLAAKARRKADPYIILVFPT